MAFRPPGGGGEGAGGEEAAAGDGGHGVPSGNEGGQQPSIMHRAGRIASADRARPRKGEW